MRNNILALAVVILTVFHPQSALAREKVCLGRACYVVDMALTPAQRQEGLMFRKSLDKGQGMFFIFDEEDIYPFWMKNMSFAIDILWLDKNKRVVHIAPDVPPCRAVPCAVYTPSAKARYVLEIPAGDALDYGIKPGDVLR